MVTRSCTRSATSTPLRWRNASPANHSAGGTVATPTDPGFHPSPARSEEHTSELQSQSNLVCRLLLEKKKLRLWRRLLPPRRRQRHRDDGKAPHHHESERTH